MALLLAVIPVWYYLIADWQVFDRPFAWGNLAAWESLVFPAMARLALIEFVLVIGVFFWLIVHTQAQFGMYPRPGKTRTSRFEGNFLKAVDIPLIVGSVVLVVYGGVERQLNPIFLGLILIIALLEHLGEQWMLARFN